MTTSIRVTAALFLGLLSGPATLMGQGVRPFFGVGLGIARPNGAYHSDASGEGFDTGFIGLMMTGVKFRGGVVLRVNGGYSENAANEQLKADLSNFFGQPTDAKFHLIGATVDLVYEFGKAFRKGYVLGGVGGYRLRLAVTSGGVTADTVRTKFAWNLGGGITWTVSRTGMFLEARYVHVAPVFGGPAVTFMPLTFGLRFGGA